MKNKAKFYLLFALSIIQGSCAHQPSDTSPSSLMHETQESAQSLANPEGSGNSVTATDDTKSSNDLVSNQQKRHAGHVSKHHAEKENAGKYHAQKHHAQKHHAEKHHAEKHHSHESHKFFEDAAFADLSAKAHDKLYLTGEASDSALKAMVAAGVKVYIDIRPESESGAEFKNRVLQSGMEFYSLPVFLENGEISEVNVDKVYELHRRFHEVGHAVACGSGVRSSGWMSLHLMRHHKMPAEKAIEIGKQAFLSDSLAERIVKYKS